MPKTANKPTNREEKTAHAEIAMIPLLGLTTLVHRELRSFIVSAGMHALEELLENERAEICGPRYRHDAERRASRGGHAKGSLVMGGRRVTVRRPRARTSDNREVALPSWSSFASSDPLNERAVEQMVVGVATRKYARSLEPLAGDVVQRGTSKSAVSRRFVELTQERMDAWLQRDLSTLDLVALMIDGIAFKDHVMLIAMAIDAEGRKHVLGLHEGATENKVSCNALLAELRDRGLRTDRSLLVVIDGGKALRASVREVFGVRALVQRCQVHKMRNVTDHLPENAAKAAKKIMQAAYRSGDAERAKKLLTNLARQLRTKHPSAAASIEEGLDETLTVMTLELPRALEQTLSSTNVIENLNSRIRDLSKRVKLWKGGEMIERWTVTAVLEASKKFRRLRGFKAMKKLVIALREHDQHLAGPLASQENAA